jgi:hypothetical protein
VLSKINTKEKGPNEGLQRTPRAPRQAHTNPPSPPSFPRKIGVAMGSKLNLKILSQLVTCVLNLTSEDLHTTGKPTPTTLTLTNDTFFFFSNLLFLFYSFILFL